VDEQFGANILHDAVRCGYITCCPAEKSGQDEFEFEYGDVFARHNEVLECWKAIMQLHHEPAVLVLTRQDVATFDRAKYAPATGVAKGASVLAEAPGGRPDVLLMASGSEVALCVEAHERLTAEGIRSRAISMPSWEFFDDQDKAYHDSVLPPRVTARVSVEQASVFGWAKYVGPEGHCIGMRSFVASAPLKDLQREFGFMVDRVIEAAKDQIQRAKA
jgi:transketolase